MQSAIVQEIFASVQGEGPSVGQRHIFIRFQGCDIACRYCDTPDTRTPGRVRVQKSPASFAHDLMRSPVSADELTLYCSRLFVPGPQKPILSLTGGEPLLQEKFLSAWLPGVKSSCSVYLETNGIRADAMSRLRKLVDVVSMDFKLPSATGLQPFWREHGEFLDAAGTANLFVKTVVTVDTAEDDLREAARLIAGHDPAIPLVIQPATGPLAPEPSLLIRFQNAALGIVGDVRIIPQVHKILQVP